MRHRVWFFFMGVAFVGAVGFVGGRVLFGEPRYEAPMLLEALGRAFELYANESRGGKYPRVSGEAGRFVPDMGALEKYGAGLGNWEAVEAYVDGAAGVDLFYCGYMLPNQRFGLRMLEAWEAVEELGFDRDITVGERELGIHGNPWHWDRTQWFDNIYRIRQGIERFLITEIGDPSAAPRMRATIPVIWEMPDERRVSGGWVLYMDGHTEWLAYPGRFPMTEDFVEGIRDVMEPAKLSDLAEQPFRIASRAPSVFRRSAVVDSPVHRFAVRVRDSLGVGKVMHCDQKPSLRVGKSMGYRILIRAWGEVGFRPGEVELALFREPLENQAEIRETLRRRLSENDQRIGVDMGSGDGYRWFALCTAWQQDVIRVDTGLVGGEDRLQVLIEHDAYRVMTRLEKRAFPALKAVVLDREFNPSIPGAVEAMELVDWAFSEENPLALENAEACVSDMVRRRIPKDLAVRLIEVLLGSYDAVELAGRAAVWAVDYRFANGVGEPLSWLGGELLERLPLESARGVYEALLLKDGENRSVRSACWSGFWERVLDAQTSVLGE